jgi:hypothetical protein
LRQPRSQALPVCACSCLDANDGTWFDILLHEVFPGDFQYGGRKGHKIFTIFLFLMLFVFATLRSMLRRRVLVSMECFLMCSDKTHGRIFLPDQKAVAVGRTPVTKITDKKVSRKQGTD